MDDLLKTIVLILGGTVSISLVALAVRLFFADRSEYRQNQDRCKDFFSPMRGGVRTVFNGSRDYRIRAGLALNRKNQWVEQGALSQEALDAVLRK